MFNNMPKPIMGEGNPLCEIGTFTIPSSGGSSGEITVPFKIKRLIIYNFASSGKISGSTINQGTLMDMYDEDISTSYQYRIYISTVNQFDAPTIPNTSSSMAIEYVNDNKFKFNCTISQYSGTFIYIATGE